MASLYSEEFNTSACPPYNGPNNTYTLGEGVQAGSPEVGSKCALSDEELRVEAIDAYNDLRDIMADGTDLTNTNSMMDISSSVEELLGMYTTLREVNGADETVNHAIETLSELVAPLNRAAEVQAQELLNSLDGDAPAVGGITNGR